MSDKESEKESEKKKKVKKKTNSQTRKQSKLKTVRKKNHFEARKTRTEGNKEEEGVEKNKMERVQSLFCFFSPTK